VGTFTPFVTITFHKEIGQDGGNRETDPGYCGGSFKAGKTPKAELIGKLLPERCARLGG
jgi:hypothetical protein